MDVNKNKALIEGAKELGRVVLIAAVSAGLVYLQQVVGLVQDHTLQIVLFTALTSLGKAADKYVHENENIDAKGVVPF